MAGKDHRNVLSNARDRATFLLSACSSPITRRHSWAPWQPLLGMLLASAHKKCLAQKVAHFGSLGLIPMIQTPFNSSCTALQYETGMKFFHWVVPKLHTIKKSINFCYFTIETLNKIRTNQWQNFLGGTKILCSHQRLSWRFAEGC